MRTSPTLSALSTVALVAALTSALPARAAEAVPVTRAQPVVVATPKGPPLAAGVVVTGPAGPSDLGSAISDALGGDAVVGEVTAGSGGTRVVRFGGYVPAALAEAVARTLRGRPDVTSAEPDYVRTIADASPVQVSDPLFPQQASIWDTSRPGGGFSTRAPAFWGRTMGSSAVRVAVLDTGMTQHPDLTWQPGRDFVDGDADPTDPGSAGLLGGANGWHGTHVAGIVAARANGIGVVGVAPGVSLVPVRVLDGSGGGSDSQIAAGIRWAAGLSSGSLANPAPAQVINMSLGGEQPCTSVLSSAINEARQRGVVVVAAAGNESADAADFAPASCPGVVTVGATDADGNRASFSNFGPTVDISAPGTGVLSTLRTSGGATYGRLSGTSMASPAVAGAAALLFSTGLSAARVEATLPLATRPAASAGTARVLDLRPTTRTSLRAPTSVRQGERASLRIRLLSSTGARPSGRVVVLDGSKVIRRATVSVRRNGSITVRTPRLQRRGVHRIRVVFVGGGTYGDSRSVVRKVRVR